MLIEKAPLRGRATVALLALLVLFWLPVILGARAACNSRHRTIPDGYAAWLKAVRTCLRAIARGEA